MADIQRRTSPLGNPEFVVPPDQQDRVFRPGVMATTIGNSVYYRSESADDPDIQGHERIHIGQNGLAVNPSAEQLKGTIPPSSADLGSSSAFPSLEPPAYAFSSFDKFSPKEQQQFYNKYINLIWGLNPKATDSVEAAMPEQLERTYIKTVPRPYATPTPQLKPESLWDLVTGKGRR